jgi:hypothetical protein
MSPPGYCLPDEDEAALAEV